jgi:hypothetical protein
MITLTGTKQQLVQPETRTWLSSFIVWSAKQNNDRLTWLAIVLSAHGCFLTPFTVMTVMATSQNFTLFMAGIGAMTMALVTNLAALPTKITIPAFALSILIDIAIVIATFSI